jgi:glycerol uptake facilitator-like aquaporin
VLSQFRPTMTLAHSPSQPRWWTLGTACSQPTFNSVCLPRAKLLRALQVIMTFTLISTVYACGIAKPGHGSMTPLAVGFSLLACAGAGGKYSGMAAPHGTTYCVL